MGLFDAAAKVCADGDEAASSEQLSSETGADQLLISEYKSRPAVLKTDSA